jgi:hypothetical protein
VTDEERARAVGDTRPDLFDDLIFGGQRDRHRHADVARAGVATDVIPHQIERAVLEVRAEHFFAGVEIERPRRDVHAGGCIRDENEIVRIGADVCTERSARLGEQPVQPARKELNRPPLQLELPFLVAREHVPRACTERAMVEKHDFRIEQKLVAKILGRHVVK